MLAHHYRFPQTSCVLWGRLGNSFSLHLLAQFVRSTKLDLTPVASAWDHGAGTFQTLPQRPAAYISQGLCLGDVHNLSRRGGGSVLYSGDVHNLSSQEGMCSLFGRRAQDEPPRGGGREQVEALALAKYGSEAGLQEAREERLQKRLKRSQARVEASLAASPAEGQQANDPTAGAVPSGASLRPSLID